MQQIYMYAIQLTRRRVRIVTWEGHLCFEVAAVVERVRVDDHQRDVPRSDFVILKLGCESAPLEEPISF